jgi:HlyD family secretion protein
MSAPAAETRPPRPVVVPDAPPGAKVIALPLKRPPVLAEFQTDALEIEERPPRRVAHLTLYVVAAFILAAVLWAALAAVDRVVVAEGRLVATAPNLVVQPLETSVIRSLHVAVGDVVQAGQTLATLDATFSAADAASLRGRLASRAAQVARLEAELEGRAYDPAGSSEDERLQALAHAQRQAYRRARLRDFDERIARTEASIATNRADRLALEPRLEVVRELETMRSQLLAGQIGSRVQLLDARNARLDMEGRIERLRTGLVELEAELRRTHAERESFVEEFRQTALEELVKLRGERDSLAEDLSKAVLRQNMVVLTAPADAVVLEVASRSIGSVVREAETLFVLVPLAVPLEAELAVAPRDIGRLALGLPVRVKFDAFPYQEHGAAEGTLRTISEGAFPRDPDQPRGDMVFRARVQLDDTRLRGLPASFRLIPGMTVTGEVRIGQRNVLDYFLHPLLRGLDESLREP